MSSQLIDLTDENDIEIMSEEDYVPKKGKCCNVECKNNSNLLLKASDSVRRFYGVEAYYKRRKVCQLCLQNYNKEKSKIVNLVKSGTNVFSPKITLSRKTFVIPEESDSDDFSFEDSSDDSECEFDLLQLKGMTKDVNNSNFSTRSSIVRDSDIEELQDVALDIIQKNNLLAQIGDGSIIIQKRLEDAQAGFDRYTQEFNLIEKEIDQIRNDFYATFEENVIYVPPLEIGPPECFPQKVSKNLEPFKLKSSDDVLCIQTSSNIKPAPPSVIVPPRFIMQKNVRENPEKTIQNLNHFKLNKSDDVSYIQTSSNIKQASPSVIVLPELLMPKNGRESFESSQKIVQNLEPFKSNSYNNISYMQTSSNVKQAPPSVIVPRKLIMQKNIRGSPQVSNFSFFEKTTIDKRQRLLDNRQISLDNRRKSISEIREIPDPSLPYPSSSKNIKPNFLNKANDLNVPVHNHTIANKKQVTQNTNTLVNISPQLNTIPEGVNQAPLLKDNSNISCPDSFHDEFSNSDNLETQPNYSSLQNFQDSVNYSALGQSKARTTESLDVSDDTSVVERSSLASYMKSSSTQKLNESGIIIVDTKHSDAFNSLPPNGPLIRSQIKVGDKVYVTKSSNLSKWIEAKIININTDNAENMYDVQFGTDNTDQLAMKTVSAKHLAYFSECQVKVPFKTRIIALVEDSHSSEYVFYVGIIGEIPTAANKYRYLVFFDDGYVQYVKHSDIRIVVRDNINVWEDVDKKSRDFIKNYLDTYPEKPMVRLQKYSFVQTELYGRWHRAQVSELDCSLAKIYFPVQTKFEWIYRGSSRFKLLFEMKLKFNLKMESDTPNVTIRRRTLSVKKKAPTVEYINLEPSDSFEHSERSFNDVDKEKQELSLETKGTENILNCDVLDNKNFLPHKCNEFCVKNINKDLDFKVSSPLLKPVLCGWKRQLSKEVKKTVTRVICLYVAPCGRRLRSYDEICNYLIMINSSFTVDMFSLDSEINLFRTWEPDSVNFYSKDITDNQEEVYISAVNSINSLPPKKLQYCSKRIISDSVSINLDPNYLVCCNCEDNCLNKFKCECWALTIETEKALSNSKKVNANIGYNYKRLYEQLPTGIFECNSNCSCQKSCLNRVVQFPIKQKLQLFKTAQRGWGVRTLNDIPRGTFICTYVGKVITDAQANTEGAIEGGDEYYADLDYIENIEKMKEGYESSVSDIEDESEDPSPSTTEEEQSTDSEDYNKKRKKRRNLYEIDEDFKLNTNLKKIATRNRSSRIQRKRSIPVKETQHKRNTSVKETHHKRNIPVKETQPTFNTLLQEDGEDSDDSSKREPKNFEPEQLEDSELLPKVTIKSLSMYYNEQYVVDSKVMGNIGRYLNHSCDPNIFCQNVFVDTHDLRFPWVSFFAMENIIAGTELTWDYSYEVGSIPNRYKKCYCRSSNCKGRFL